MTAPIVTLVTCADLPNLSSDEAGLPDALRDRGLEPRIAVWNDPSVDWEASDLTVVRSVRDYAKDQGIAGFGMFFQKAGLGVIADLC